MGTKVPWLLASQATDFAKEADLEKVSSKLDDFGKVSGDFAKSSEVPTETEVKELDNRLDAYDLVSGTFLTKTSADNDYAKKADIPSVEGFMKTTDADAKYLTKTSADTDYASKTHSHTVSDVTDFPTDLVHSNDLAVYTKRSELSTSANWDDAYRYTSTHVGTLTINGTEYDGTEDKTITIQTEGGGILPPAGADGDYIYRISSDAANSGWKPMPTTGKPIRGVDGQISVSDKTTYDEVGLHENVLAKLEELENPLTITGGDNIDVVEGENDTVVINYTGKEFPADGLHDGLNVLSANGTDYEWVPGEQYYAYIKTYDQDGKPDINALAQNVMIETHANNVGTNYNRIRGNVGSKTFETYTLPNHWSKMFVSGTNDTATAGEFVTVTPGAGNGNNISWYDIEPKLSDTAEGMQGWDASNKKWAKIEAGETYKFDTATLSGTGSTENPIGVDTDALNEMYLPMSGNANDNPITGNVVIQDNYISIRNTSQATEAQIAANNATDTFPFKKGAWIKRHDLDGNNNNMAAFGVTNSNNLTDWDDGARTAMDPDNLVDTTTVNTPIGIYQKNGAAGGGWAAWTPRLSFPMMVHDEGTAISWGKDNTLHFILEPES